MELAYKYELKLKEKCTKGSIKQRNINLDKNQIKKPKLSTNSLLQGFDDKLGKT